MNVGAGSVARLFAALACFFRFQELLLAAGVGASLLVMFFAPVEWAAFAAGLLYFAGVLAWFHFGGLR